MTKASHSRSVHIARPAEQVIAVLRDIANQHRWWPGQHKSQVLETDEAGRVVRAMIGVDVKVARDEFEVTYTHDRGDAGYRWEMTGTSAVQRSQHGSWTITQTGADSCDAKMELALDAKLPLPGMVVSMTTKDTVKGALNGLKKRCETGR